MPDLTTKLIEAAPEKLVDTGDGTFVRRVLSVGATGSAIAVRPSANYRLLQAAATTNSNLVSATARALHKIVGNCVRTSPVYLKIYDKATAPTVGTDVPILTISFPGVGTFDYDFKGHPFTLGLGFALTTGFADADTGAVTLGDILALNIAWSV